jgi:hypothetical protein
MRPMEASIKPAIAVVVPSTTLTSDIGEDKELALMLNNARIPFATFGFTALTCKLPDVCAGIFATQLEIHCWPTEHTALRCSLTSASPVVGDFVYRRRFKAITTAGLENA